MADHAERFLILTGGPGSGKSTLIDALQQAGFTRSIEAGRGIIQDQVSIGGPAVPWNDRALFAELMLCWEMRSYRMAERQRGPVFFDRGVPDVVGYLRLSNLPVPAYFEKAAETFRYNRSVFIAPAWREIFQQDRERKADDIALDALANTVVGCVQEARTDITCAPIVGYIGHRPSPIR